MITKTFIFPKEFDLYEVGERVVFYSLGVPKIVRVLGSREPQAWDEVQMLLLEGINSDGRFSKGHCAWVNADEVFQPPNDCCGECAYQANKECFHDDAPLLLEDLSKIHENCPYLGKSDRPHSFRLYKGLNTHGIPKMVAFTPAI